MEVPKRWISLRYQIKEAPRKKERFFRKDMPLGLSKLSKEKEDKWSFVKCESLGKHIEYKHLAENIRISPLPITLIETN